MAIQRTMRKAMRERAFRLARHDLAMFLQDHEEELLRIFREEIQRIDNEIPEENFFIDIKMVPLGETIVKAVLRAMNRFLTEDGVTAIGTKSSAAQAAEETTVDPEP
jgi:antitoxin component HigA of HigAB toxin-antitoxin module